MSDHKKVLSLAKINKIDSNDYSKSSVLAQNKKSTTPKNGSLMIGKEFFPNKRIESKRASAQEEAQYER